MGKRNRAATLPTNLPQLQNLIKRDPVSYKEDFLQQFRHYESQLTIFKLKPDEDAEDFGSLVTFISQVAQCYPEETRAFPQQIIDILSENYQIMYPELRRTLAQGTSGSDGGPARQEKEPFKQEMSENAIAAKKSLDVCIELYKKNVWNDDKTVNVIAEACFHPVTKIKVTALKFFLGSNEDEESGSSSEDDVPDIRRLQHVNQINKKKKSKARKMEKALANVRKKEKQKHKAENFNFSALHLLNDPQGFAEKLFSILQQSSNNDRFEVKLMTMNLISRIIGIHKLMLLGFYPYLIRYLQPHQRDVTLVLAILAQATHELVPPDALEPVVKAIANGFINDRCAAEVMIAGLNAIREICARQPLAIDATLLQDLTEYKSDRTKGVMMAARSLIALYRELNPELLHRKDRGRTASMNMNDYKPLQYGEVKVVTDEVIDEVTGEKRKLDSTQHEELSDVVDVNTITGPRKKAKQDYDERVESARAGREGREKYGAHKNKRAEGASTTNKEKVRNKAFMMVVHKRNTLTMKKMSLRKKQILLKKQQGKKKR
ncbi:1983_t:CDS:10 [Paraglomus brasilianum]|uniref:Protein SDA1 n=1 Tax=Paraglomus brasilianum TaxID=144538 RepID=A0A9N9G4W5_9GLOM|nr:1983_t:CDS:10 [Paraglomus brasilianum]